VILYDKTRDKPRINYPCEWGFKIIGKDKEKLKKCIDDIMAHRDYKFREGNLSRNGKFVSMNTSCIVHSEEDRHKLFTAFSNHCDVKIVI